MRRLLLRLAAAAAALLAAATPASADVSAATPGASPSPLPIATPGPAPLPDAADRDGRKAGATAVPAGRTPSAGATAPRGDAPVFLVYLPAVANQNPQEVAAAATALAEELGSTLPGHRVDVSFFRRAEDAGSFARAERSRLAFVLCEAPFLVDLAPDHDLTPILRFVSGGEPTERKLVVVKAGGPRRLAELKGKVLAAVPVPARGLPAHLGRVFDGLLPAGWFSRIEPAQDELAAVAAALFGTADAALVSEHNPLLPEKLGSELRTVFTSPPLSLPVLAVERTHGASGVEAALLEAAAQLFGRPAGASIRSGLRIEGLSPIPAGPERAELLKPGARPGRPLEVVAPDPASVALPELPRLEAAELPFVVSLEVPFVPLTAEGAPR